MGFIEPDLSEQIMMCDSTINYCSPSVACFVAFLCGHAASQLFCAVLAWMGSYCSYWQSFTLCYSCCLYL